MALKVGFIGAGKMATALARGILSQGQVLAHGAADLTASCPKEDAALLEPIKALGGQTTHDNHELVAKSDVVILAVKPFVVPIILDEVKSSVDSSKLIVSIAAGVRLDALQTKLNDGSKVMRVMPNTPSLVQQGATVYAPGNFCNGDDGDVVERIFNAVGPKCYQVHESMIDAVTGISGSGPAYMYMIIEAMADAGVKQGLPRALAYQLAAQTMVGAGQMVLQTGLHPAVLKDEVCSPGGSTITALDQLEKSGLRTCIMQAVEAATKRCNQMGS